MCLMSKMSEKINSINDLIINEKISSVKRKALEIEKASYENPKPSKIASTAVSNVLEKPKGQDKIQCDLCKAVGKMKFVENDWGLKIHKSRCHKDKNVKGKK